MEENKRDDRLVWHQGFYGGIELEFRPWKDGLTFSKERELTKEPLIVDMLIVKKAPGLRIDSSLGRFFKGHNLIEYKSPSDTLSVDKFSKAVSYAYLYKSQGETENSISFSDVSLSVYCDHHPRKLFQELGKERSVTVEEREAGIYSVEGFPGLTVRVVVIRELPAGEHLALRVLRSQADEEDIRRFLEETADLDQPGDRSNWIAVLRISMAANKETYQKLRGEHFMDMDSVVKFIAPDLLEKERTEGRAEGKAEGKAEGIQEGSIKRQTDVIQAMLRDNVSIEKITKYTQASMERITEIARTIGVSAPLA